MCLCKKPSNNDLPMFFFCKLTPLSHLRSHIITLSSKKVTVLPGPPRTPTPSNTAFKYYARRIRGRGALSPLPLRGSFRNKKWNCTHSLGFPACPEKKREQKGPPSFWRRAAGGRGRFDKMHYFIKGLVGWLVVAAR